MPGEVGEVRTRHSGRRDGEECVTCGYHGDMVESNLALSIATTKLSSKMSGVTWLLGVSVVILSGIFATQIMTASSFGSINTTILNQQQDIDALKTLTKDHSSIVTTVADLKHQVEGLNERYPVYFKK
jgi:hypothetical protein